MVLKLKSLACAAALALALPAMAHTQTYRAFLLGSSETPANSSPGFGGVNVVVDFDLVTMKVQATFLDLIGNVTAAHIHCCTAVPFTGNVGVATTLPTFTGFPSGVTFGAYSQTFDMAATGSYSSAFLTANGGVSGAFNALVAGMDAGKAYFNLHTTSFPGGELRGLLAPIPEPSTYALMALGLAGVGLVARRRRSSGG